MIDFLTRNFNFIIYALEFLTAIVGLLCIKKYKNTTTRYFIYFLVYIFMVEIFGASLIYFPKFPPVQIIRSTGVNSLNWYNLFWFFGSIVFVLYYFYSIIKLDSFKVAIKIIGALFSISMLGHFFLYFELFMHSHPKIYQILGLITTFICISLYLIEFLKSDSILQIFKTFGFYASIGLFLWWLIITPIIFFENYNTIADWDFVNLKRRIFLCANIFMYSTFTFALIWCKPEQEINKV
ncbi:MAG: hypothetical protein ABJM36_08835 [Algibacter sp.]|uniref:hypothetical protein n=1 Tax=Algibacter sp. TaxID=1872428 RepID=UPI00329737F3